MSTRAQAPPRSTDAASPDRRSRLPARLLLAAFACVLVALLALAAADARVVAEEARVPWSEAPLREVETLGVRLYVDHEFQPRLDVLTSWLLAATGTVCGFAALAIAGRARDRRAGRFLALACAGAWWLAVDEALGLHETIGDNLGFLTGVPGIGHPDDVLPALYLAAALTVAIPFRRTLAASRAAMRTFAAAAVPAALAAIADTTDSVHDGLEDAFEAATFALLLAGFVVLALTLVRRELAQPRGE